MEQEDYFIQTALEQVTKDLELTKQERAFIKRLTYGTVEHRLYIDYAINQVSKIKVGKMKPAVRQVLRLSVYQLLYMDNIPESAVCNEGVKLIKKRKMYRLTGFVNGVLRQFIRIKDTLTLPEKSEDLTHYLSLKYSFEPVLIKYLLKDYDEETVERILQISNEEAPLTIRVNTSQISIEDLKDLFKDEGIMYQSGRWLEEALQIRGYDQIPKINGFSEGYFQVQDESSMLVGKVGVEAKVRRIIDVCAAPGGKAVHAAELVGAAGQVLAFDLSGHKVKLIQENIKRLKLTNIQAAVWDATKIQSSLRGKGDLIIADVPCSGLGIIRKKPDIKWQMTEEKIQILVKIQRKILLAVKEYVNEGGLLIYSTCTLTKAENEENIKWFLKENTDYTLEKIKAPYANEMTGMVQLLPSSEGPDGFFIAKLRKK